MHKLDRYLVYTRSAWAIKSCFAMMIPMDHKKLNCGNDHDKQSKVWSQRWLLQIMFASIKTQVTKINCNNNHLIKITMLDCDKVTQGIITTRTRSRVLRVRMDSTINQIGFQIWEQVLLYDSKIVTKNNNHTQTKQWFFKSIKCSATNICTMLDFLQTWNKNKFWPTVKKISLTCSWLTDDINNKTQRGKDDTTSLNFCWSTNNPKKNHQAHIHL